MVKILHLFNNLMNLYGETGNIKMLERRLKAGSVAFKTVKAMPKDVVDWDFDFVYIGSGTEKSMFASLKEAQNFTDKLNKLIFEKNAVVLLTGNSMPLFGKKIVAESGEEVEGLSILDIETYETYNTPTMQDCVFDCELIHSKIVGFINRATKIISNEKPLFKVIKGVGNSPDDRFEGMQKNNLFATHLIGPILAKNPDFLELVIKKLANKTREFEYFAMKLDDMQKAYEVTLGELLK
ncbi:MAG: hypothetical protein ACI4PK_02465 [Oscillospiraceae bacterium]